MIHADRREENGDDNDHHMYHRNCEVIYVVSLRKKLHDDDGHDDGHDDAGKDC